MLLPSSFCGVFAHFWVGERLLGSLEEAYAVVVDIQVWAGSYDTTAHQASDIAYAPLQGAEMAAVWRRLDASEARAAELAASLEQARVGGKEDWKS